VRERHPEPQGPARRRRRRTVRGPEGRPRDAGDARADELLESHPGARTRRSPSITDGDSAAGPQAPRSGTSRPRQRSAVRSGSSEPATWSRSTSRGARLDVKLSPEELEARRREWKPRPPRIQHGCLGKYTSMATSASTGAVLRLVILGDVRPRHSSVAARTVSVSSRPKLDRDAARRTPPRPPAAARVPSTGLRIRDRPADGRHSRAPSRSDSSRALRGLRSGAFSRHLRTRGFEPFVHLAAEPTRRRHRGLDDLSSRRMSRRSPRRRRSRRTGGSTPRRRASRCVAPTVDRVRMCGSTPET